MLESGFLFLFFTKQKSAHICTGQLRWIFVHYVSVCMHAYMCWYMCVFSLGCQPQERDPLLETEQLLIGLELTSQTRLVGQWVLRLLLSPLPSCWDDKHSVTMPAIYMGAGHQTQDPALARQALYPLSHISSPIFCLSIGFCTIVTSLKYTVLKINII